MTVAKKRWRSLSIPCTNYRKSIKRVQRGFSIARGPLREVETLAEIAHGLGYIQIEELAEFRELLDHIGRRLTRLLKRLQA